MIKPYIPGDYIFNRLVDDTWGSEEVKSKRKARRQAKKDIKKAFR